MARVEAVGRKPLCCRPFSLADGMILVAATAAGLGVSRATSAGLPGLDLKVSEVPYVAMILGTWALLPSLLTWTWAVALMRLRRPRPARDQFARQPGAMACSIVTALMAIPVAVVIMDFFGNPVPNPVEQGQLAPVLLGSMLAGVAVACCWLLMAFCKRWCPEPTWIDRLGRTIGIGWIAVSLSYGYLAFGSLLFSSR